MTLGTIRQLLAVPALVLLLSPLAACEEEGSGGKDEDTAATGDDDDTTETGDDDDTTGDDDDTTGDDDDDDDDDSGVADQAEGDYNGLAAGIVNDTDYDLNVTPASPTSVTVSGQGIATFTVPLVDDNGILQQGKWSEGTFRLDGDHLELAHTAQGFTFDGYRQ